ncbi:MAG TPA: hypothetical protein V6C85_30160 [Allocoleopsis sp.]
MMNTMKKVTLVALLVAVASAGSMAQANAQIWNNNRNNNRVDNIRNEFQDYLNRISQEADSFASGIDRDLDRSRLNNKNAEDQINQLAKDIKRYARNAKNNFDRQRPVRDDVQQLLDASDRMDAFLRRTRISLSRDTERSWSDLRNDTNRLRTAADRANQYNNGRGYNNGWWR